MIDEVKKQWTINFPFKGCFGFIVFFCFRTGCLKVFFFFFKIVCVLPFRVFKVRIH